MVKIDATSNSALILGTDYDIDGMSNNLSPFNNLSVQKLINYRQANGIRIPTNHVVRFASPFWNYAEDLANNNNIWFQLGFNQMYNFTNRTGLTAMQKAAQINITIIFDQIGFNWRDSPTLESQMNNYSDADIVNLGNNSWPGGSNYGNFQLDWEIDLHIEDSGAAMRFLSLYLKGARQVTDGAGVSNAGVEVYGFKNALDFYKPFGGDAHLYPYFLLDQHLVADGGKDFGKLGESNSLLYQGNFIAAKYTVCIGFYLKTAFTNSGVLYQRDANGNKIIHNVLGKNVYVFRNGSLKPNTQVMINDVSSALTNDIQSKLYTMAQTQTAPIPPTTTTLLMETQNGVPVPVVLAPGYSDFRIHNGLDNDWFFTNSENYRSEIELSAFWLHQLGFNILKTRSDIQASASASGTAYNLSIPDDNLAIKTQVILRDETEATPPSSTYYARFADTFLTECAIYCTFLSGCNQLVIWGLNDESNFLSIYHDIFPSKGTKGLKGTMGLNYPVGESHNGGYRNNYLYQDNLPSYFIQVVTAALTRKDKFADMFEDPSRKYVIPEKDWDVPTVWGAVQQRGLLSGNRLLWYAACTQLEQNDVIVITITDTRNNQVYTAQVSYRKPFFDAFGLVLGTHDINDFRVSYTDYYGIARQNLIPITT